MQNLRSAATASASLKKGFFMKRSIQTALAGALAFLMAFGALPLTSAGHSSAITIETKGGTQSVGAAKASGSFPYANRIKMKDIAGYKVSDFLDKKGQGTGKLDRNSNARSQQLQTSNWYTNASLTHLLESIYVATSSSYPIPGYGPDVMEEAAEEEEDMATADTVESVTDEIAVAADEPMAEESSGSFSGTNVQVAGVDESEIIKTDGKYIYYMNNTAGVAIVQAGKKPRQVASISPARQSNASYNASYTDMYLDGKQLVLIATQYQASLYADAATGGYHSASTGFYVYDISNPQKPSLQRSIEVSGYLNTSRLYNHTLYFITNSGHYASYDSSIATLLPAYSDSALGADSYVLPPKDIHMLTRSNSYGGMNLSVVGAFSLSNDTPIAPKAYESNLSSVYMSKNALVLADTQYQYIGGQSARTVALEENLTFYTLPNDGQSTTYLNRFILGKNGLTFSAMGIVPGNLVSQYAMDEYNGTFRVATTSQDNRGRNENGVYVFAAQTLKQMGAVTGLAKNESIQSVRFKGDTAYVVTFLNTDPLFVIDLSAPKRPKVVGELKIPGFSTYLHPYTDKYVIGLGVEVSETFVRNSDGSESVVGSTQSGVKVSMFDVSNPQKPKEVHKLIIGGPNTHSESLYNPKSILFDMRKGIMAFPIQFRQTSVSSGNRRSEESWSGGLVVEFSARGFDIGAKLKMDDYFGMNSRFVYIGDVLYYASNQGYGGKSSIVAMDYASYRLLNAIDLKF